MVTAVIESRAAYEELAIRRAAQNVNAFIELVMIDEKKRQLKQGIIHRQLQSFLDGSTSGVVMFPRSHGKTTQMMGRIAWEIGHNPEMRIKIVSSSDSIATARGAAIRQIIEKPIYRAVFPHIQRGVKWTDGAWSIKRNTISPESTLECFGIDSAILGGRADKIYYDDPDDEEVIYSPTIRNRNVIRVDNAWQNLLSPDGISYELCTPWHEADIAHTRRDWRLLRIAIQNGQSIWPEAWSNDALARKKKDIGSIAFARNFEMQVLSPESAIFKLFWFRYYESLPSMFNRLVIAVDLAISEKSEADYTVMGLFGLDANRKIYLIDMLRAHLDFPSTIRAIESMFVSARERFHLTPTVGIESTAYQRSLPQQLKHSTMIPVKELTAKGSKIERAQKQSVHIENGRVLFHGANGQIFPDQQALYDELIRFPTGIHDDCVDMLCYGIEMLADDGGADFAVAPAERDELARLPGFGFGSPLSSGLPGFDTFGARR